MKGYIQVYTGNGKGKTTASIGLAVRAAGAGLNVYIVQFLKNGDYSEIKALSQFKNISIEQYGLGRFVKGKPSKEDITAGQAGYLRLCELLKAGKHDVVIAEEANVALMCGLFSEEEMLTLMEMKPDHVELIITGRGATQKIIDRADLVTEMKEIKHYYTQGIKARPGIEK
ncbi:MAG: cob(I)yrinic acid a,c-diamide adenosyltransferase [Proteobacteria bacterium]|nr:cob(I)yrinic acid a,c-diamide adenosyltransferase [Pseudomonadota bacterium]MBU1390084.1 cob(I)yrinic acid a,c-diamide adenosyltransferase [Pseudomonadota bacterium]MBU1544965.1 cob(I)yrinic acid a,c-diamide adenosyltransferase [Pseudomonadota bacterium]MBU2429828.1 cob(I)yrinic acid a,c-diamide adenosyltransferase [Pseudomonadota bacterium]MBU2482674.1 cob(I)yrinic acid a,c-diamide adenosyltransferase [Pseudomonadota bacterium]